jgi:hypothetical protein
MESYLRGSSVFSIYTSSKQALHKLESDLAFGTGIAALSQVLDCTKRGWKDSFHITGVRNKTPEEKTTGVTTEDTETETCFRKAKFTSAEGCVGTWAQHTQRGRAVCPSL